MKRIFALSLILALSISQFAIAQTSYTYTGKPIFQILTKRGGNTLGIIHVELFPKIAPNHVRNFDSLVSFSFYDTTAFHRVVPGFVIQGGDPNSRHGPISTWGYGQAGQPTVNAEFSILKHLKGILSMARSSNINSATSQFFICVAPAPNLNGLYSIFGRVISGLNWVDTIVNAPRMTVTYTSMPIQKIEMFVTRIGSNDSIPATPTLIAPPTGTVGVDTLTSIQLKWNTVTGALLYHLNVSTDSLFVNDTIRSVDLLNLNYNLNNLTASTKYFWRITANNGGNTSMSQVWSLTTASPAVPVDTTNTTGIHSYSNSKQQPVVYPNPGNGKFTFSNLEKGVKIEILDIAGKVIYEGVSKDNTLVADLEGKNKGIYLYRITDSKKGTRQGKLILR